MLPAFRIGLSWATGLSLVVTSGAARAVCDATATAKQSSQRFVIEQDTVYDPATKLTWMRCSYGQTPRRGGGCDGDVKRVDWDVAMALPGPGGNAWRVPTKEELHSIVEPECKKPAINDDVFPDTALMAYWTSTPSGPSYAWHINFRWGISAWQYLRSNQYAVRLVHDGR